MTRLLSLRSATLVLLAAGAWAADPADRPHYQAPDWKPRVVIPAEDALRGDFWPASP